MRISVHLVSGLSLHPISLPWHKDRKWGKLLAWLCPVTSHLLNPYKGENGVHLLI